MGFLKILVVFLFTCSCAKLDYLVEQGMGQLSLQSRAKDNQEFMKNVRIPRSERDKVKKIQELKTYFYLYWGKKETNIYTKTTKLNSPAVTYLIVASPHNEIKPVENCFPLMGCFPYLGFFSLKSAQEFAKSRQAEGYITWQRPVYAYSTLGYFTDSILSSFFHYNDYELAELIFHELFHTIFFVKNSVELNENLANYFAKQMLEDYFKASNQLDYLKISLKEEIEDKALVQQVVNLVSELQELYQKLLPKTKEESAEILNEFLENKFRPEILKKCASLNIEPKKCFPLERKWNNASFAAFLTYEKNSNDLEKQQKKLGLSLKEYYNFIEKKYQEFNNQKEVEEFSEYLLK